MFYCVETTNDISYYIQADLSTQSEGCVIGTTISRNVKVTIYIHQFQGVVEVVEPNLIVSNSFWLRAFAVKFFLASQIRCKA
jgi:hypothetical protein